MKRALLLAAVLLGACSHAKTVKPPGDSETKSETTPGAPSGVPATPSAILQPGAAAQIQKALVDRGFLGGDYKSDELDSVTREALRKFQNSQDLPATGIPDGESVKHLGLDPDKIFSKPLKGRE